MIQSWVFSIQREINQNTVLEVAYNGNHSYAAADHRRLESGRSEPVTATCNDSCKRLHRRRPRAGPSFGPITWVDPVGNNDYNGLSVRFEHRFGHGLYFLNSFTWSHAMGDSEQVLEAFSTYQAANPQNIYNLQQRIRPVDVRREADERHQRGLRPSVRKGQTIRIAR